MFTRLFKGLKERYEAWSEYQRAYDELEGLDDRSLADIGISRSDIPYILSRRSVPNAAPIKGSAPELRHAA
jgi:uncharacterized protein YjiS (DUF1127 family)